ncbi:MAG TPA: 16S rRNA processing protein RimM [Desulfobulbaceae bacterium]|nr:16S rRNA processing protein RimM [Desulfobulbaceae bacterium]
MADLTGDDFVPLGKITKPHGIRGEVKIYPYSGSPEQFVGAYGHVHIAADDQGPLIEQTIERARIQGKQVLAKFTNCSDRAAAEHIVGREVFVRKDNLPELDENEFYLHELEGKELVDVSGAFLGISSRILTTGGQDLLIVQNKGREFMVPIVGAFIQSIDNDRVVLDLPPGLLDIND